MEKPVEQSTTAVAATAASAAGALLDALPRSATAATDEQLLGAVNDLAALGRVQQVAMAVLATEVSARSVKLEGAQTLATRNGQKDAAGLLQSVARIPKRSVRQLLSYGDAICGRDSLTGTALPPRWEHIAEAAFSGTVDVEAVAPVIRHLDDVRLHADADMLEAAESGMMRIASQGTPEYTASQMRVWKEALDPDGARPREQMQRQKRFFSIGKENRDGMTPVRGLLTPDARANLVAAISTSTNPRTRVSFEPADAASGSASPGKDSDAVSDEGDRSPDCTETADSAVESVDAADAAAEASLPVGVGSHDLDPRTHGQKLHDALDAVVTAGHRAAVTGARSRRTMTQVIITASLDDVRSGNATGWVNGGTEPVGPVTTERITCDSGYRALVLGENGEALWLGTTQRAFTPQQKLAIAARDETCAWPECDIPADWCEVHHAVPWSMGGKTNIDNGLLLCSAHHHMLHAQNWHIYMRDGIPYLTPPPFMTRSNQPIRLGRNRARAVRRTRRRARHRATADGKDPPDTS
ncbi:HNH endonuclease signature motif containing protein [Paramicrobacterium agarici]|uniref:HNH endonuclease signature motif containing protein n=1 Tax=Paramicrobacterium agarici TaxID=630514 RepID=UPI00114EA612|nr:HNH endonuclease signature motif containing protein [Microbacterium agarici]